MLRRIWGWLAAPERPEVRMSRTLDTDFVTRMRDTRCDAIGQSRESIRQQRRLRSNPVADDIFGGPPPVERGQP